MEARDRKSRLEKKFARIALAMYRLCRDNGLDYGTVFLSDNQKDTVINISVKDGNRHVVNMYTIVR